MLRLAIYILFLFFSNAAISLEDTSSNQETDYEELDEMFGGIDIDESKTFFELERDVEEVKNASSRNLNSIIDLQNKIKEIQKNEVTLNFKTPGQFQRIDTSVGAFFISAKEATPYLDGYRIVFLIGNPYYATFCSPTLRVTWCVPFRGAKSELLKLYEWLKKTKIKTKEFSILKDISPGKWNQIEVVLESCQLEELENITVIMGFGSVSLSNENQ